MFKEFMGIPAHALLVHAAVVFVPLLVLAGMVYAVVPKLRARVGWVAALLAVAAPVAAFLAKESGEQLQEVLTAKNYPPQILDKVGEHAEHGDQTFLFSLGLGIATGLLLFVTSRHERVRNLPSWVSRVLCGVVVVLAVLSMIFVYLAGDSGAKAVWTGVL